MADKPTVRELVWTAIPLLKHLGAARKLFLTPLARYWVAPCCDDSHHLNNYRLPGYLPRLGDAIHALRDGIRDTLFTKRIDNFRVLCPNRMIGVGQRRGIPSDEEAAASAALLGTDPVHPTGAAYRMMVDLIEKDLSNADARYTNPPKNVNNDKRPCPDLSREWAEWVRGCSTASARRDLLPPPQTRGGEVMRSGTPCSQGARRSKANSMAALAVGGGVTTPLSLAGAPTSSGDAPTEATASSASPQQSAIGLHLVLAILYHVPYLYIIS